MLDDIEDEVMDGEGYQYGKWSEYVEQLPAAQPPLEEFEWCTDCKEYDQKNHCCHRFTKVIRQTVEELKSQTQWIPCSERLPEENMWTICQNNAGAMMIGKYDIEFGWMFPAYFDGIIAWQPLPEPYKGGEQDGQDD